MPLATLLVQNGHVRAEDILRVVAERLSIPFVELDGDASARELDTTALRRLDPGVANQLMALPLGIDDEGKLIVAVADPFNQEKLGTLRRAAGGEVTLTLAPKKALQGLDRCRLLGTCCRDCQW